jgi:HK97 family phage major capsid protein
MSKLTDLQGQLEERRTKLKAIFDQAGPDRDMAKVTLIQGDSTAKVEEIRKLDAELNDLFMQIKAEKDGADELAAIKRRNDQFDAVDRPPIHPTDPNRKAHRDEPAKSLGQLFVESDAYKMRPAGMGYGPQSVLDVGPAEIGAAIFKRTAGWAAESLRTGTVVPFATRPIQVTDLFSTAVTDSALVVYMEETTFTNAAAERAEGAVYAESAFALTQRTQSVETVGTAVPVTDEQLADVAQARSYLDGRVEFAVRQRLDSQLCNGTGVTPLILGILNATNLQTQAKGADPTPDAIYKAMQKVRVTGRAFPSALIIHPDDWTDIRLLRTADGIYIWGAPYDPGPDMIWGIQVAQCDAIAVNTAIVGDFSPMMVQLYVRSGLVIQVGYVNDDFRLGQQTIRAGVRVANVIYRGSAFSTITGI